MIMTRSLLNKQVQEVNKDNNDNIDDDEKYLEENFDMGAEIYK